jgi:hypothetical protein
LWEINRVNQGNFRRANYFSLLNRFRRRDPNPIAPFRYFSSSRVSSLSFLSPAFFFFNIWRQWRVLCIAGRWIIVFPRVFPLSCNFNRATLP